jgi:hypothetical protein
MNGITGSEWTIFQYMMYELRTGDDMVVLTPMDIRNQTGLSMPSIYKAMSMLIKRAIIAKSYKTNFYYINTLLFFHGKFSIYIDKWIRNNPAYEDHLQPIKDNIDEINSIEED